ncbi:MAG TPA: GatB/YqeY domain-containing protein [Candidatus Pacearchaeota archaeon]|nr:GatB/YqeY domain-containing protein [Candidatus Pacearchaeota archaeon]
MLKDKINEDFKAAFKEKRKSELAVLKNLKAALLNKEKEKQFQAGKAGEDIAQAALADDDIIAVISTEVKKLRDAIALFEQGGRADLVAQNKGEIEVLMRYLPAQLGEDEIKKLVADAVAQAGAATIKDMGKVMGILMPEIKGKADSGLVGKLVKEALS